MVRTLLSALAVLMCLALFSLTVFCYEAPDPHEYIPAEVANVLSDELCGDIVDNGGMTVPGVLSVLKDMLKKAFAPALDTFSTLLSCVVLSMLFYGMSGLAGTTLSERMFTYIVSLCLSLILYRLLLSLWSEVAAALEKLTTMMNAMTVTTASVYALSGQPASAALSGVHIMTVVTVIEDVLSLAGAPFLKICFGLSLVSCVSGSVDLGSLAEFVRKTFTTAMVFIMTVLSAVMSFQSVLSRSADSMAMRTVRLVSGHFIPIVGGFVAEAAGTVSAGMGVLKGAVGAAGIAAVAITLGHPLLLIWMHRLAVTLCSVICDIAGQGTLGSLLRCIAGLFNFMTALLCCVGVLFLIELILFAVPFGSVAV